MKPDTKFNFSPTAY